ncbi:hypothetical protein TNCV_1661891 [Trichonephila clavipes]|nr:hypothetical protein TNCV_1661891 [Trichonephila clavipes]
MRHGDTLNILRIESVVERLMKGKVRGGEDQDVLQNLVGTEPIHTVTCIMLKSAANDRHITLKTNPKTFRQRRRQLKRLFGSLPIIGRLGEFGQWSPIS